MEFKIELKEALEEIRKRNAKTVLLQLPEGLKTETGHLIEEVEKTGAKAIALMDPCFGACDIPEEKAKALNADLVLHFGHTEMLSSAIPTIYVQVSYQLDAEKIAGLVEKKLKEKNLKIAGLCASAQYAEILGEIAKILEKKKITAMVGKGNSRVKQSGQVLGCNYSAAHAVEKNVEAMVFFGDGLFHVLGLVYSSKKQVLLVNPLRLEARWIEAEREMFLRKRFALIAQAKEAKSFGILVSTKKGQMHVKKALEIKKLLEEKGKKAHLLAADYLKAEYFLGTNFEAFVCTACPRIAAEDYLQFKKPVLNPKELEIALGKRELEEYEFEEL